MQTTEMVADVCRCVSDEMPEAGEEDIDEGRSDEPSLAPP